MADSVFLGSVYATAELRTDKFQEGASQVKNQLNDLDGNTSARMASIGKSFTSAGTALSIGLTAPLVLFGKQSFDVANETEVKWKEVEKVYGSTADAFERDVGKMQTAVDELSVKFGRNKGMVLDALGAIAAIGYEGPKAIDMLTQSLEFATTGNMELGMATDYVVAISKIYQVEGDKLRGTLANLNVVENSTAASMQDLGEATTIAGSAGKAAGVDINELSGYMAALRERAIPAGEAANGLKTIFTRLRSPDSIDFLASFGIQVEKSNGQLMEANEVLDQYAKIWPKLTDAQKEEAAQVTAGLFQKNKLLGLMDDLTSKNSTYRATLDNLANAEGAVTKYEQEMAIFLDTNKTKVAQAKVAWDNFKVSIGGIVADAIIPLLTNLAGLAKQFDTMNPAVQRAAVYFGMFLAAVGPLLVVIGQMMQGFVALQKAFTFLKIVPAISKGFSMLGTALTFVAGALGISVGWLLVIIAVIALVAVGVYLLWKNWDTVSKFLTESWASVVAFGKGLWEGFVSWLGGIWNGLTTAVSGVWTSITQAFQTGWQAIVNFFTVSIPTFIGQFIAFMGQLPSMIMSFIWNQIILGAVYFLALLVGLFIYGIPALIDSMMTWFMALPARLAAMWASLQAWWTSSWNAISAWTVATVTSLVNGIMNWFSQLPGRILAVLVAVQNWFTTKWNEIWAWLTTNIPRMVDDIMSFILTLPSRVTNAINTVKNAFVDGFQRTWNAITSELSTWPGRLYDWGVNLMKSFADGIRSAIGQIVDAWKAGMDKAKNMIKGNSPPKEGPYKNIDVWGYNVGSAWADGLRSAMSDFSLPSLAGLGGGGFSSPSVSPAPAPVTNSPHFTVQVGIYAGTPMEKRELARQLNESLLEYQRSIGQNI